MTASALVSPVLDFHPSVTYFTELKALFKDCSLCVVFIELASRRALSGAEEISTRPILERLLELSGSPGIMKLLVFAYLLGCLFILTVVAIAPQKAVIVTYPEGTPDSVMDQAKDTIRKAGGMITHEYKLIK